MVIDLHYSGTFVPNPLVYFAPERVTLQDIDFKAMNFSSFIRLLNNVTQERCKSVYYCVPDVRLSQGLQAIQNDCDYTEFLEIGAENNGRLNVYVDHYEEPLCEWIQNEEPEPEDDDGQSEDDEDVKFNDGIKCDHQEDDEVISIRRTVNDHFLSKPCLVEVESRLDEEPNVDAPPIC